MTPLSWIYMLSVWAGILALVVFCFVRAFRKPRIDRLDESRDGRIDP